MNITFDFTDRVVVITGAAGGIGHATAELFGRSGAQVVMVDRDAGRLSQFAAQHPAAGTQIIEADVTGPGELDRVVQAIADRFGRIDVLVPAAGIYPERRVDAMTDDEWGVVIDVNLNSVFRLVRRALPLMSDGSSIIAISSIAGHRGSAEHAHYAASKAGLMGLTRSLAVELDGRVRVNAVSPGIIETAMTERLRAVRGDTLTTQTPAHRFGRPDEVAAVIAFLASDAASFINGESLQANGGLLTI